MAYTYSINSDNKLVEINIFGVDTASDVIERITTITADQKWEPGFSVLMDMSKLEELAVDFQDSYKITEIHKLMTTIIGNSKVALVCNQLHIFGIGRMWQSLSETLNIEFEIFEEIEMAKDWLLA